jgi:hypothetical protein
MDERIDHGEHIVQGGKVYLGRRVRDEHNGGLGSDDDEAPPQISSVEHQKKIRQWPPAPYPRCPLPRPPGEPP